MVVLGLGSNVGNRLAFLRKAVHELKYSGIFRVDSLSPIYESEASLLPGSPASWNLPYLNLAILIKTDLEPLQVLEQVKRIEAKLGRQDRQRWAPREIDIDILAMDQQVVESERLILPHPRLMERSFAFVPFADVLPHWVCPGLIEACTIKEWTRRWTDSSQKGTSLARSEHFLTEFVTVFNFTPDSFSDGGEWIGPTVFPSVFEKRVRQLLAQGCSIFEAGAESTRPGAKPVGSNEELKRLGPFFTFLKTFIPDQEPPVWSLDTHHAETAQRGLAEGIHWLNDVQGFDDPQMLEVACHSQADCVVMHHRGVPPEPQSLYGPLSRESRGMNVESPVESILEWGHKKIENLTRLGIPKERLILDPGLGFGKTREQSWILVRDIQRLQEWGVRLLVGHSRKSFLSAPALPGSFARFSTKLPAALMMSETLIERDLQTLTLSLFLASQGVDYLRIHSPENHVPAFRTWARVSGGIQCFPTTSKSSMHCNPKVSTLKKFQAWSR